jgi:hypothetical protein
MVPRNLNDRLEPLINELIEEGGLDAASLASILVAAQDSINHGDCLELSRRVWVAWSELRTRDQESMEVSLTIPG